MELWINQKQESVEQNTVVTGLLRQLGIDNVEGLAVAVNNEVVPRVQWPHHFLKEQDRISILRAVQGG